MLQVNLSIGDPRRCTGCGLILAAQLFVNRYRCRDCHAAKAREYLAANREKVNSWRREYTRRNRDKYRQHNRNWQDRNEDIVRARSKARWAASSPAARLLAKAIERSRALGIEITLSEKDIVIPDRCPVLGIPIRPGSGSHHDGSPTLDRIDNERGYVPGNVAVISFRANALKRDGTADEHERIASWMRKRMRP